MLTPYSFRKLNEESLTVSECIQKSMQTIKSFIPTNLKQTEICLDPEVDDQKRLEFGVIKFATENVFPEEKKSIPKNVSRQS